MYEVPVFTRISVYDYRRILAQSTELAAQRSRLPARDEVEALERELEATRDMQRQLESMKGTLETKVLWLRHRLRQARRHKPNVGWPYVERRRVPRN